MISGWIGPRTKRWYFGRGWLKVEDGNNKQAVGFQVMLASRDKGNNTELKSKYQGTDR